MNKDMILVSSGFIIPSNRLFDLVTKDNTYRESVLGKRNGVAKDAILSDLVKAGALSSSATCNDVYLKYTHNPTFDNYIEMVDIVSEIFKPISLIEFMKIQARNTYLSPLGFKLCMDMVTDRLYKTYRDYSVAPSFFRLAKPSDISPEEILRRETEINKIFKHNPNISFADIFASMIQDRGALPAFFQYVLTDSNRGGLYG